MKKDKIPKIEEELDLIIQIFFLWKYYYIYFLNLIYNYKQEFKINSNKNINKELMQGAVYVLVGIITINILLYVLEEYQVLTINIHNIINEIQLVIAYISISIFFILYAIMLNIIVLKKIKIELIKASIVTTIKVFNLTYPFLTIAFIFFLDMSFTKTINTDFKDIQYILLTNKYLQSSFTIIACSFIYLLWYLTSNFITKYTYIKSKIKKLLQFIGVFFITSLIYNIIFLPITFNVAFKYVINKDNLCNEVFNAKFKIDEEYTLIDLDVDLKKCYKNLN